MNRDFTLTVNAKAVAVTTEDARPLLDVLREELRLTGAKYGCGEGECGACTVLVDGRPVRSCVTTVAEVAGKQIQTIEGLAAGERLHPVQQAFLAEHALQCGYCVPGQIMSAVALLGKTPKPSREQILESMNGNICRCCNYPNILAAVERAAHGM
jgi:aerobic-type carbon monoxide dehydrogenase small subunit (CoxS/CutS family)